MGMVDRSGYILQDLREARGVVVGEGHLDRFQHLDVAGGETLSTETDWGNFLVANWLHGTGRPTPDLRFDYVEDDASGAFSRKRPFVWPDETIRAERLAARPYTFEIPKGAVRAGFATLMERAAARAPRARIDGVLVARQLSGAVEMAVGVLKQASKELNDRIMMQRMRRLQEEPGETPE